MLMEEHVAAGFLELIKLEAYISRSNQPRGWKGVRNTECVPDDPHGGLQKPVPPVPGNLMSFSGIHMVHHTCYTGIHVCKTHVQFKKFIFSKRSSWQFVEK